MTADPTPTSIIASLRARLDAVSDLADHLAGNEAAPLIREALNGYVPTGDLDPTPATGADQGCQIVWVDQSIPRQRCETHGIEWEGSGGCTGADQGGALTDDEREALLRAWPWPSDPGIVGDGRGFGRVAAAVERILAAQLADERERIAKTVEAMCPGHGPEGGTCEYEDAAAAIREGGQHG